MGVIFQGAKIYRHEAGDKRLFKKSALHESVLYVKVHSPHTADCQNWFNSIIEDVRPS